MEQLFLPTEPFKNFTADHWVPIVVLSLIWFCVTIYYKNRDEIKKYKVAFFISLIPFLAVVGRMCFTLYEDTFTIREELPLHLCRVIALVMPVFIWYKNFKWINTLYFLIMAGTLQAIITADLQYTLPHYSYFLYWIFHVTLIWIPLFIIINLKKVPVYKDMIRAFVAVNVFMVLTLIINFVLDSNYFFTRAKPQGESLLDYFGPWPIYIFVVELLMVFLFILVFIPFYKKENRHPTF
jgi:hypothetical integral membrane protein (TIGR02206 family)